MMTMIRYCQPTSLFRELQKELFPLMATLTEENKEVATSWTPRVDIKEEAEEFVIYADIPGVDPASIDISVEKNTLTVKGERKAFYEEKESENNYYRVERAFGKFYREFTLPGSLESSKISAKVKHGVLAIHLPKAKEEKYQQKIRVQEEN